MIPARRAPARVRSYMGHTITSCGLSWYVDRTPGKIDGAFAPTLAAAKALVRKINRRPELPNPLAR